MHSWVISVCRSQCSLCDSLWKKHQRLYLINCFRSHGIYQTDGLLSFLNDKLSPVRLLWGFCSWFVSCTISKDPHIYTAAFNASFYHQNTKRTYYVSIQLNRNLIYIPIYIYYFLPINISSVYIDRFKKAWVQFFI